MLRVRRVLILAVARILPTVSLCGKTAAAGSFFRDRYRFYNTGYGRVACHAQMQLLAVRLEHSRNQLPRDCTRVLFAHRIWGDLLLRLDREAQDPASIVLDQRRSFLSEALIAPDAYGGADLRVLSRSRLIAFSMGQSCMS